MKTLAGNNQKKWPSMLSIPVFLLLVIVFWQFVSLVVNVIISYVGGWGMILTLPFSFKYILGPAMDFSLDWYNKHFC